MVSGSGAAGGYTPIMARTERQAAAVEIKAPPLVKWAYWHIASPCRTRRRLASSYRCAPLPPSLLIRSIEPNPPIVIRRRSLRGHAQWSGGKYQVNILYSCCTEVQCTRTRLFMLCTRIIGTPASPIFDTSFTSFHAEFLIIFS